MSAAASFPCHKCNARFTRSHGLKRHVESVHEQRMQFECHVCQRRFTLQSVLTDHLLTHSDATPFECCICHESFKSRKTKSRHMKKMHHQSESDDDEDTEAKAAAESKRVDRENRKRVREVAAAAAAANAAVSHSLDEEADEASSSAEEQMKKRPRPSTIHPCTFDGCSATFHYRHVLANHIRAKHTHETPFACTVCHKRFPTLARQSAHQKTHLSLLTQTELEAMDKGITTFASE